jgi:hexokinase
VEELMIGSTEGAKLEQFALILKAQFREGLLMNPECMLPSYNYQLPNGYERGQYLALDVGGSTLRVALVELQSRAARSSERNIIRMQSFKIDPTVKALVGNAFFDWMVTRVLETVDGEGQNRDSGSPLLMGLAWSFPIE